jgi:hypothetical protein
MTIDEAVEIATAMAEETSHANELLMRDPQVEQECIAIFMLVDLVKRQWKSPSFQSSSLQQRH